MATPGVTITGSLKDLSGAANAGKLVWALVNFGDNPPLINGTSLVAPVTIVTQAANDGTFSQVLWGNYQITPSTTFYQVGILSADGSQTIVAAYQFSAGGSFDLSTLNPLNNVPGIGVNTPSISKVAHEWLDSFVATTGVFTQSQPAFTDISGTASTAQIPSLDASKITSGTVAAAQMPSPTAATLGGVESFAAVTHQFLTSISTSGVPASAQPAFTDLSGVAVAGQIPSLDASKITTGQIALARGGTGVDLSASGSSTAILAQDASHVVSARILVAGDIPSLAASKITSGLRLRAHRHAGESACVEHRFMTDWSVMVLLDILASTNGRESRGFPAQGRLAPPQECLASRPRSLHRTCAF